MYHDRQGREIEDLEGDNMRRDWQEQLKQETYRLHAVFDTFDASFLDPPEKAYYIFDVYGGKVELSAQDALNLLAWLTDQQEEILQYVTGLREKALQDTSESRQDDREGP
jgi:hypothetical protein